MQVENLLAAARPDRDLEPEVVEPRLPGGRDDELEHALALVRGQLPDVAQRFDVPLRDDEHMDVRARMEVAKCDEAIGSSHLV